MPVPKIAPHSTRFLQAVHIYHRTMYHTAVSYKVNSTTAVRTSTPSIDSTVQASHEYSCNQLGTPEVISRAMSLYRLCRYELNHELSLARSLRRQRDEEATALGSARRRRQREEEAAARGGSLNAAGVSASSPRPTDGSARKEAPSAREELPAVSAASSQGRARRGRLARPEAADAMACNGKEPTKERTRVLVTGKGPSCVQWRCRSCIWTHPLQVSALHRHGLMAMHGPRGVRPKRRQDARRNARNGASVRSHAAASRGSQAQVALAASALSSRCATATLSSSWK